MVGQAFIDQGGDAPCRTLLGVRLVVLRECAVRDLASLVARAHGGDPPDTVSFALAMCG